MYDKAMAEAVQTAQKRLMNTAGGGSVLMQVTQDLSDLAVLTERLDPSKIDFDKGGLEKIKITNYWNRFEESYPALKLLFEKLGRSKKILHNSITTVNRFADEYNAVYEKFCAVPEDQRDREYIQQAVVCENMSLMMKNSVDEHRTVYENLEKLLNIFEVSLDMAILLAKQKSNRVLGETLGSAPMLSSISNISFQEQYRKLRGVLG